MSKIKNFHRLLSAAISASLAVSGIGLSAAITAKSNPVGAAAIGDLNGDNVTDISDAVLLQKFLIKKVANLGGANGDLNGDGKVNVFDLITLKRILLSTSVSDVNYIHLNNSQISVEGSGMELSENNTVVTITAGGTYQIDGTLNEGQIRVNAADTDKVSIILNGVNVTCSTNAPVYVVNADKTVITLAEGTENILNDSDVYTDAEADSTIYSKDDLTINGSGSLTVNSNYLYSITSNDDLKINGGSITVNHNSVDPEGAAVKGKKSVVIKNGKLKVTCAADETETGADGIISNESAEGTGYIEISGGTVNVNAKGGDAVKSKKNYVSITGGKVTLKSETDAIQAGTEINISDTAEVYAYAKRSLTAGEGYKANITGGSVVATSNTELADTSGITVNSMLLKFTEKQDKSEIIIKKNGESVYSITPDKKYTYALVVNPALENGTYNVFTGGVQMTHADAASAGEFVKSSGVGAYNSVEAMTGTVVIPDSNEITLASNEITFSGTGAALSADKKTITISEPGVYSVKGEMTDGQIVVDVDKTTYPEGLVELSLEGMKLTNTSTSPIYVAAIGDECVISPKKGTENTISDGTSYTNADSGVGAIYSKDDLKLKGKGTLNVNGNCQDAIVGKDDVRIYNGTINVTAADDGIRGKESVKIGNDTETDFSTLKLTVKTTGGDGIKTTEETDTAKGTVTINGGTIKINSYADGIQSIRDVNINGGDIDIYTYQGSSFTGTATGGSTGGFGGGFGGGMQDGNTNKTDISAKGIKAGDTDLSITAGININGGTINIDSSDDCIHCNGDMNLYGGVMTLASADDGCHSDSTLNIGNSSSNVLDDVKIYISTCYEGIEGMNINQNSGSVIVNSTDDGYNAAGGADGSGSTTPGGWNQGGRPGMSGSGSTGNYSLNIKGGLAFVNTTDGDHDGFDSNGSLTISGGYAISNGNEPFDADGTKSYTGGVYVINKGSGGMGGGMPGGSEMTSTVSKSVSASAGTRITLANGSDVILSFIANKNVSTLTAGCSAYPSAKFYTGGTISGTPAAVGGTQEIYTSGNISGVS